jgi:hypothetical protein
MRAVIQPEGAGWIVEICGDDCPVDRYFVKELFIEDEDIGKGIWIGGGSGREENLEPVRYPRPLPHTT